MNSEDTSDWIFTFNLSMPVEYSGKINGAPNIEINTNNNNGITGFTITIKNLSYDKAEEKSKNKARNLANIITIKSSMPVEANLVSYHNISKNNELSKVIMTSTHRYKIDGAIKDLDLNESKIKRITNSTFPCNESYKYLSKAIFHYYNNNPIDCIKEGFRIISNKPDFSCSFNEYKSIRDLNSHGQSPGQHYKQCTRELFENTFTHDDFDYELDPSSGTIIIDWKSEKNLKSLFQ
jgi:hypothetical protein